MAKYSPQRLPSHSPIDSTSSISAYAPTPMASHSKKRGLSLNESLTRPSSLELLMLKTRSLYRDRSAGIKLLNALCTPTRSSRNRQIPYAAAPRTRNRSSRSTAKTRKMSSLRSSLLRLISGASAAGPWPGVVPVTSAPQRRPRQASPAGVPVRSLSRSAGSSGAYVTCPRRAQPNKLQSMDKRIGAWPSAHPGACCSPAAGVAGLGRAERVVGSDTGLHPGIGQHRRQGVLRAPPGAVAGGDQLGRQLG